MLRTTTSALLILFIAAASFIASNANADTRVVASYTTISVDMHCAACAKKIATQLHTVGGVKEVRADLKKNLAYVIAAQGKKVSPKDMWEAVEKAGFKPVKLSGPSGTFTKKPKV